MAQRDELDARDKGKGVAQGWYAYGRTQGLNKYGKNYYFQHLLIDPNLYMLMMKMRFFATDMLFLIMTGMNLNEVIIWLLIMIIYKKQYSAKTFFTNYSYKQS